MRPVGGSATEAFDGGVGALGGKSGGVAPEGTAKTGVRVASAAGQNGARPRRLLPVPTKAETGDGFPGGIRKVVNPHTLPVCAKIPNVSGGKAEPTQHGAIGVGHQPTHANAGDRGGGGEQAASPTVVYGLIVDRSEVARTAAVVLSRRLWPPREEVNVTIRASFPVL